MKNLQMLDGDDMENKKTVGQRALFATKIGVIATTVGSAVGLGNIWRFPYTPFDKYAFF